MSPDSDEGRPREEGGRAGPACGGRPGAGASEVGRRHAAAAHPTPGAYSYYPHVAHIMHSAEMYVLLLPAAVGEVGVRQAFDAARISSGRDMWSCRAGTGGLNWR